MVVAKFAMVQWSKLTLTNGPLRIVLVSNLTSHLLSSCLKQKRLLQQSTVTINFRTHVKPTYSRSWLKKRLFFNHARDLHLTGHKMDSLPRAKQCTVHHIGLENINFIKRLANLSSKNTVSGALLFKYWHYYSCI